jgi:hypothetical protein
MLFILTVRARVEVKYLDTAATVFFDLPPAGMAILSEQ